MINDKMKKNQAIDLEKVVSMARNLFDAGMYWIEKQNLNMANACNNNVHSFLEQIKLHDEVLAEELTKEFEQLAYEIAYAEDWLMNNGPSWEAMAME